MKYQYILNGEILFETNEVSEYFKYLMNLDDHKQALYSTLYDLLDKSKGYTCEMANK